MRSSFMKVIAKSKPIKNYVKFKSIKKTNVKYFSG